MILNTKSKNMKTLTAIFLLFCITHLANAQTVILSEDFNYPIGENLNQHNWKPLTSATDNPIKIVMGLSRNEGGAVYLNKSGEDVIRSFTAVADEKISLSFQFTYKDMQKISSYGGIGCYLYNGNTDINSSNYFMFLSSREEPTVPLIKFSLYGAWCAGGANYLIIRDSQEKTIAGLLLDFNDLSPNLPENKEVTNISFDYYLKGSQAGKAVVSSTSKVLGVLTTNEGVVTSQTKVNNIANIVLSQSDVNVGSMVIIDSMRVSKPQVITHLESRTNEAFDVTIFPNSTDGRIELLINDKTPEGDIDVKLNDNLGNILLQNTGNWESLKPQIEQVLSKNASGQYFLSVKKGNDSKTIRVFKQ